MNSNSMVEITQLRPEGVEALSPGRAACIHCPGLRAFGLSARSKRTVRVIIDVFLSRNASLRHLK